MIIKIALYSNGMECIILYNYNDTMQQSNYVAKILQCYNNEHV